MYLRKLIGLGIVAFLVGCDGGGGDSNFSRNSNSAGSISISGTALEVETLTAMLSDPDGVNMSSVVYQWYSDGNAIAGATGSTYTLTYYEVGETITVTARYTDNQGITSTVTSAATLAVLTANTPGSLVIIGIASFGQTLTAELTDANGTASATIALQWQADGTNVAGATANTFTLTDAQIGANITVTAVYTDDDGYAENLTSAAIGPVVSMGTVTISGILLVGSTISADVVDGDGTTTINYQWQSDGMDITGATSQTLLLDAPVRGTTISVRTTYTDNRGNDETPSATANDVVFSVIVDSESSLRTALASAVDGDWIGLGSATGTSGTSDYKDMSATADSELVLNVDNLVLTLTAGSTAVVSGATCLVMDSGTTGVSIQGLTFEELTWVASNSCRGPDASIVVNGMGNTFADNSILSEGVHDSGSISSTEPYHYVALRGTNNVVERNLFSGKNMDLEGSTITMYNSASNTGNIVQYNLFLDFAGDGSDSGGHAIQLGRSTGSDSTAVGNHRIQYNRFDNVQADHKLLRVQASGNLITGNTVVNSTGMIALEDGLANVASRNIIVPVGDDNDDGGISFAPLGHTVSNNYIANLRTTSSSRGAFVLNTDPLSGSGNTSLLNGMGPFTLTIEKNTIVNVRSAVTLELADCDDFDSILSFNDNLIMNVAEGVVAAVSATALGVGNNGGQGRGIWIDAFTSGGVLSEDWNASCMLDTSSSFSGNRYWSPNLANSEDVEGATMLNFDPVPMANDNTYSSEGNPEFTVNTNDFVVGTGSNAGKGVDTSLLYLIRETDVGPGSTWIWTSGGGDSNFSRNSNSAGSISISGTALEVETLTAMLSDPDGVNMSSVVYQWYSDGNAIAGATGSTYTLTYYEVGETITVTARYTDNQGITSTVTSAATLAVLTANTPGSLVIIGIASFGQTLTAELTDANGTASATIALQWQADGTNVAGATANTFTLTDAQIGANITVTAVYTDDDGYAENLTSAAIGPVVSMGTVTISGILLVGSTISADVVDGDGTTTINYQWQSDGMDITGATSQTLLLDAPVRGTTISVRTTYTDNRGNDETPSATANDVVFSVIVDSESSLRTALASAVDGDWIGLGSAIGTSGANDYKDMSATADSELVLNVDNLVLTLTAGSTAVVSGATCLVMNSGTTGVSIQGLTFEELTWVASNSCRGPDASIVVNGMGNTFADNSILSEGVHDSGSISSTEPYHYVALRGTNNVVERNLFSGKNMDLEGSAITMYNSASNTGNIVQYNLFFDFAGDGSDSGGHAIQLGRSTGSDSTAVGNHRIQYNRFDNVQADRRLLRVQASGNLITGNTVVNSTGMIALEDGLANVASRNIIVPVGDDNDDGGISFAPLGHTVSNNYIANLRTTSSSRGAFVLNTDPLNGSGNTSLLNGMGPFTLTIEKNTIVNVRSAVTLELADCDDFDSILSFNDNLIMNVAEGVVAAVSATALGVGNNGGQGRGIWIDAFTSGGVLSEDWNASCMLDTSSSFSGNRYWSPNLANSEDVEGATMLNFDPVPMANDNTYSSEGNPEFTVNTNDFVVGTGSNAGKGVDTSLLYLIRETDVGPGSTWIWTIL